MTAPDTGLVERLDCEELAILHGQQVVVTFKSTDAAFALFNELEARAFLAEHIDGSVEAG